MKTVINDPFLIDMKAELIDKGFTKDLLDYIESVAEYKVQSALDNMDLRDDHYFNELSEKIKCLV
jgi:hypothetical protein